MFTFNIGGVPALKMIPMDAIQSDTFYLSSDQSAVITQDRDTDIYIVFDLTSGKMCLYDPSCTYELRENHPSCSMLFPSETVEISLRLEIMGGGVE